MSAFLYLLLFDPKLAVARRTCALAVYLAIVIAGSIPGARAGIGEYASGVVLHSLAYAGLAFLWFTGSAGSPAARAGKAMLAVTVMGAGDELVQSLLPYRVGSVNDWLLDCMAGFATCTLLWLLVPRTALAR
jgi:hypothetical protein